MLRTHFPPQTSFQAPFISEDCAGDSTSPYFSDMPWSFAEATPMALVDRASLPEMQAGYLFCMACHGPFGILLRWWLEPLRL